MADWVAADVEWNTPCGKRKVSKRDLWEQARKPVPELAKMSCPDDLIGLTSYYNELRSMTGDYEKPLTMDIIEGWQRHREFKLEKWEREAMFAIDRAFRRVVPGVIELGANLDAKDAQAEQKKQGKVTRRG